MRTTHRTLQAPPANGVEVLLVAAATLTGEFSAADLTVAAWRADPRRFGLAGYDYPHSHRVEMELSRKSALLKKGWLERVRPGVYVITDAGYEQAAKLRSSRLFPAPHRKRAAKAEALRRQVRDCVGMLLSVSLSAGDRARTQTLIARVASAESINWDGTNGDES